MYRNLIRKIFESIAFSLRNKRISRCPNRIVEGFLHLFSEEEVFIAFFRLIIAIIEITSPHTRMVRAICYVDTQ